jgi:hypothetical protein
LCFIDISSVPEIKATLPRKNCLPSRALRRLPKPNEHSNHPQNRQIQQSLLDRRGWPSLAAGNYEVVTDEELIEGVSFPVYRRVALAAAPGAQQQAGQGHAQHLV